MKGEYLIEESNKILSKYIIISHIKDEKGSIGLLGLGANGEKAIIQCVDYLLEKRDGRYKSLTKRLVDIAIKNNYKYFIFVYSTKELIDLDLNKVSEYFYNEERTWNCRGGDLLNTIYGNVDLVKKSFEILRV